MISLQEMAELKSSHELLHLMLIVYKKLCACYCVEAAKQSEIK